MASASPNNPTAIGAEQSVNSNICQRMSRVIARVAASAPPTASTSTTSATASISPHSVHPTSLDLTHLVPPHWIQPIHRIHRIHPIPVHRVQLQSATASPGSSSGSQVRPRRTCSQSHLNRVNTAGWEEGSTPSTRPLPPDPFHLIRERYS